MNSPLRKDDLLARSDEQIREESRARHELNPDRADALGGMAHPDADTRPLDSQKPVRAGSEDLEPRRIPVSIEAGRSREPEDTRPQDAGFMQDLHTRWSELQNVFVDDPRNAVQRADELVSQAIQRINERQNAERSRLGQQWQRTDNLSTEDLRLAFQGYRSLFRSLTNLHAG